MNKILALIGLIIVILGFYLYMGYYNISATEPHMNFVQEGFQTIKINSVKHHTKDLIKPAMSNDDIMTSGFEHYDAMCVKCHGGPGMEETSLQKGLNPKPPKFPDDLGEDLKIEQIYWITKNGIKMSGMPGFGPTHSDEELWNIAGFVVELPEISAEQYKQLKRESTGHSHGTISDNTTEKSGDAHKHDSADTHQH